MKTARWSSSLPRFPQAAPWRALTCLLVAGWTWAMAPRGAQAVEYVLEPGDIIRITVFQNPELTTEARVSEAGTIAFPLIGTVAVRGLELPAAEQKIADRLREGGYVLQPQVSILPVQTRGSQVAVLGQVNRPGRYPLEGPDVRLSTLLAMAGGPTATAADTLVLVGVRNGKPFRREIDLSALFAKGEGQDPPLESGDTLYIDRAPMFYIYGEVQRPGAFRLERNMSVMQALATGGGLTNRGTDRGLRLHRRAPDGKLEVIEPALDDILQPNDVLYVQESLF
ncbi:polysaccharide export protein EpsE [Candidatus Methylocalor cossyra]|uniref:Capsule polysaccharide export protein n=1 Tax=Candidatus Methylocalor cossyra TaxID=3108543 RepID=A0ABM9NJT2_9GAMM